MAETNHYPAASPRDNRMAVENVGQSNVPHRSAFADGVGRFCRDSMGVLGLVTVVLLILSAVFADSLSSYDPTAIGTARLSPPSAEHWLGTDDVGRDTLARVLYGGRTALLVGIGSVAAAVALGAVLGFVAAFAPVWLDNLILLWLDTVRSYPMIILAMAVGPMFGGGLFTVIGILVATTMPYYGRIFRTTAMSLRSAEFIVAADAMGASRLRIIFRHILPNAIGPILILASMDIPGLIATESAISFLGVGIKPPQSSWGLILDGGYHYITTTPWLIIAGGIPLVVSTLSFTFLAEALRDAFDPKLKGRAG